MRVYSYIAPNEVKSFEGDIKPYFDHVTATQGFPADTQHLISKTTPYPFSYDMLKLTRLAPQLSNSERSLLRAAMPGSSLTTGLGILLRWVSSMSEISAIVESSTFCT